MAKFGKCRMCGEYKELVFDFGLCPDCIEKIKSMDR